MLDELQSSDFLPYLNQEFLIQLEGTAAIGLELVEVAEWGEASGKNRHRPFSLIFLGPVSRHYLPQHTYPLEHQEMGTLDLFIVPLGPQGGRMQYQAIFS